MTLKILIAFDESENAMRAAEYVAKSLLPSSEVTLFNVSLNSDALCKMNSPELTPYFTSQQATFCAMEDKKREIVETAMKKARTALIAAGFSPENISFRIETQKKNVAKDIIKEAENGYDMIVLGRKGISGFKDFLIGSTSHKVLNGSADITVMVVH